MPADRDDLSLRLAAASAADTSRGLNYNTLFSLVRDHLGPAAPAEVDVLKKGARVDFFSYPIGEYLRTTWNAVDRLEPTFGGADEVLTELGRRTITGFLASMIGRTVFAVGGKDPRRMLASGAPGYKAAVSYGERTVEFPGPRQAVMSFRRDFMPPVFHQAVILAGLQATDAIRPRVVGRALTLLDSVYEIEWE
ncbi:MAG: TIGR02265 family protein [Anaeromyxobacter sp.]|nr:TIGR02265 family protein [Anaeromyxobacter sp.]MBL0277141.1 TIGR02265 family protein [Anaeromyxobacter sp.]